MSDYQYKMVNGELVPLTPAEIAELEERDKNPPSSLPVDTATLATLANSRLDRGIEVGYEAVNQVGEEIDVARRQRRQITVEDVEQQLADLVDAVRTMINAQRSIEPPTPPPAPPIAPEPLAASLEIPPRKPKRPVPPPPKRRK